MQFYMGNFTKKKVCLDYCFVRNKTKINFNKFLNIRDKLEFTLENDWMFVLANRCRCVTERKCCIHKRKMLLSIVTVTSTMLV